MYRNFTKLSFAGVVAVALLAFGITSFFAPAWAAKVKTCADGNISACVLDALDAYLAQQVKIVFVSSTEQNGNLGGVAGADAICRGLAADAGLHGLYRAWIATSSTDDPVSRFYQSPAPYILVDGTMVATDWDDLTDGTLLAPIDIDETGGVHSGDFAWTNVNTDGSLTSAVTTEQCQGWTVTNVGGKLGQVDTAGALWTGPDGVGGCVGVHHIYCFGQ